jgi:peptidase E
MRRLLITIAIGITIGIVIIGFSDGALIQCPTIIRQEL